MENSSSAKSRYEALKVRRQPFLDRARALAAVTIPSLLPPEGHNAHMALPQPWSGLGARCVVNLSSRLMTAILPPGQSPSRLTIPAEVLAKEGADSVPPDLERAFSLVERIMTSEIERRSWRKTTNTTMQHLIVTGNCLERFLPDNSIKCYRLDQYVCVRSPNGDPVEMVVEEFLTPASLPDNLRSLVGNKAGHGAAQLIPLYTWIQNVGGEWIVHQEIEDQIVPGSVGTYKTHLPWLPLRWAEVIGEDYGRGKCEEHYADHMSVEGLTKSMIEGAGMASRHVQMIRPNAAGGLNLRRRLAKAANGDWVVGNPEDVAMLKFENFPQMQFVAEELNILKQDLASAYLLNSAMRRDAERVTAYELRQMAEELEGTLGGVYSMLNQEMSLPRMRRLMVQMQAKGQLPEWPDGQVEPVILTGLEALGREQDVQRVGTALQFVNGLPQEATDYIKWKTMLSKAFVGLGIADAVNSEQEVAQIREQRAALEALTAAAPGMVDGAADAAAQTQGQPAQ